MKLTEVKTIEQLKRLYDHSAMTWEGLAESSFGEAMEACCREGREGEGFLTKGETMNRLCKLTGRNAYPKGLNIFSIVDFKGLAINYGARWMDDVIDNNSRAEGRYVFGEMVRWAR